MVCVCADFCVCVNLIGASLRLIILCPWSSQSWGRHHLRYLCLAQASSEIHCLFLLRVPLCYLKMLAAASGNWWCAVAMFMFFERSWGATGSCVTLGSMKSSTLPWWTLFMSWTFLIVRDPAWNARHRMKCRQTDDMLEGSQNVTAEMQIPRVPATLAAITRAMAGRFPMGTLQGLPCEICVACGYSCDKVVVLRWVGPGELAPLSLIDRRVLPSASLPFGADRARRKIRVWPGAIPTPRIG